MADTPNTTPITDVTPPTIEKHSTSMAQNNIQPEATVSEESKPLNANNQTISPLNNDIKPESSAPTEVNEPIVEPKPESAPAAPAPPEVSEEPKPAMPFEATDSLPVTKANDATQATDNMQSPRIYDTKEYRVPIKDSMHSHGALGKIVAALVSVTLMLAVLYVVVMYVIK